MTIDLFKHATIDGQPGLVNSKAHQYALLLVPYRLVETEQGIVGAMDSVTGNPLYLVWSPITAQQKIAIS